MIILRLILSTLVTWVLSTSALLAQDVTLTSRDGSMVIEGVLISFDGEYYQIDSTYGELTLDATGVTCDGPGCPSVDDFTAHLRIVGASTAGQTLLPELIRAFAGQEGLTVRRISYTDRLFSLQLLDNSSQTQAEFAFDLSTTEQGFAALAADSADMVLASREVSDAEAEQIIHSGLGDMRDAQRSRLLALDALVPIVSTENSLRQISADALLAVLSREITDWAMLSETDEPIRILLPPENSGIGHVLKAQFGLENYPPEALIISDPDMLADMVANDPFAIGLTRLSDRGSARTLPITGACSAALFATDLSVKTEDYPLPAPVFLYTPAQRLPRIARTFLRFLDSETAQNIVSRAGFTNQMIERIPLSTQGIRVAHAVQQAGSEVTLPDLQLVIAEMQRADRLSLSFRFRPGSTALDSQSRANVRRLAELLESGAFDGQELLFAGFSDGEGAASANRDIAQRRAETVLAAVAEAADLMDESRITLRAQGYGEALPIACDDSEWGRESNRRVELWVHRP